MGNNYNYKYKYKVITDIDGTLIFSKNSNEKININPNDYKCIEKSKYNSLKEISFMSIKSYNIFKDILQSNIVDIIPCTFRNYHEVCNIDIFTDYNKKNICKFLICEGGNCIYYFDKLDYDWDNIIKDKINKNFNESDYALLKYIREEFANDINNNNIKAIKISNNNYFYRIICYDEMSAVWLYENIMSKNKTFNSKNIVISRQGRQLLIYPEFVNKENATKYLIEKYFSHKYDKIITAGDYNLDLNFINLGDIRFILKNTNLFEYLKNSSVNMSNYILIEKDDLNENIKKYTGGI